MKITEISKLIETCHKSGVQELTLGDLKVVFFQVNSTKDELYLTLPANSPNNVLTDINSQLESEEFKLDTLFLTDPARYEEELAQKND